MLRAPHPRPRSKVPAPLYGVHLLAPGLGSATCCRRVGVWPLGHTALSPYRRNTGVSSLARVSLIGSKMSRLLDEAFGLERTRLCRRACRRSTRREQA